MRYKLDTRSNLFKRYEEFVVSKVLCGSKPAPVHSACKTRHLLVELRWLNFFAMPLTEGLPIPYVRDVWAHRCAEAPTNPTRELDRRKHGNHEGGGVP